MNSAIKKDVWTVPLATHFSKATDLISLPCIF